MHRRVELHLMFNAGKMLTAPAESTLCFGGVVPACFHRLAATRFCNSIIAASTSRADCFFGHQRTNLVLPTIFFFPVTNITSQFVCINHLHNDTRRCTTSVADGSTSIFTLLQLVQQRHQNS
jgi:hypothetical protein